MIAERLKAGLKWPTVQSCGSLIHYRPGRV